MKKGFSLVELMVVIAIIAILSTLALFGITKAQASARDVQRQQIMNGIRSALERYYTDKQYYPAKTNNFAGLFVGATPLLSGYATTPTDPGSGCTTAMSSGAWAPCGSGTLPVYYYEEPSSDGCGTTTGDQVYQLRLDKESGGKSYFCSPK